MFSAIGPNTERPAASIGRVDVAVVEVIDRDDLVTHEIAHHVDQHC
jgi:hypothetical protein